MSIKLSLSRLFATMLLVLVCATTASANSWQYNKQGTTYKFSGGSGIPSDPYLISTAQDLADLAALVNVKRDYVSSKYFKQTKDITLTSLTVENGEVKNFDEKTCQEWTPIGMYGHIWDDDFQGVYDGGGHYISGLYLGEKSQDIYYIGLFGKLYNAIIRNLTLKNVYINHDINSSKRDYSSDMAAFVGRMKSSSLHNVKVENCLIKVNTKSGATACGGVVGSSANNNFYDVSFTGDFNIPDATYELKCGGFIGKKDNGFVNFKRCKTGNGTMHVDVSSGIQKAKTIYLGGFVGYADEQDLNHKQTYLYGCVNKMNIDVASSTGTQNKGLVEAYNISRYIYVVERSANLGNISFADNIAGEMGFVNTVRNSIKDCVNYGKYTANSANVKACPISHYHKNSQKAIDVTKYESIPVYRMICPKEANNVKAGTYYSDGTELSMEEIKNQRWDLEKTLNERCNESVWGLIKESTIIYGYDIVDCPMPVECGALVNSLYGDGSEDNPYQIGSEADLRKLCETSQGRIIQSFEHYKLTADINMEGKEPMGEIGSPKYPFCGVFDGNGHVISGLTESSNALFYWLRGTVKNLSIVNMNFNTKELYPNYAAIALIVGTKKNIDFYDENERPQITNCYVGGNINIYTDSKDAITFSGLCHRVEGTNDITISNCYLKGSLSAESQYATDNDIKYYGLVGYDNQLTANLTVDHCYASFTPSNTKGHNVSTAFIASIKNAKLTNSYWVCPNSTKDEYSLDCDNGLRTKFTDNENWIVEKAALRPVLKNTHIYSITNADGKELYVDAIPEGYVGNNIYNLDLSDASNKGFSEDLLMWSLPNMAIYDPETSTDYILNCKLNPTSDFTYKPHDSAASKGMMRYPLTISNSGYSMLCLPCTIHKGDLPEGSKLMVCSSFTTDSESETNYSNIVECDSIPAGLPFIAYVPGTVGTTIDVVLRGNIVKEPVYKVDDFKNFDSYMAGTFSNGHKAYFCQSIENSNGKLVAKYTKSADMTPFSGYINLNGDQEYYKDVVLNNYLLLNENDNRIGDLIKENADSEEDNIKFKRTLKQDQWNTICLPFDMSDEQVKNVFGDGTKIEKLSSVGYADGTCTMQFAAENGIEAGVAYLIKPSKIADNGVYSIDNIKLINEDPEKDPKTVTMDGETFDLGLYGSYEKQILAGGDNPFGSVFGNVYFIQQDKIYKVADGQTVTQKGFRCYIQASSAKATQALQSARMIHSDGTTTGLQLIEVGTNADGRIYSIQGMEVNNPTQQGVYIKNGRKYVKK